MPSVHIPVLTGPVIEWLAPAAPGLLVDATVGLGGHAEALLEAAPGFRLLGVDRDPQAVAEARRRLEPFGRRATVVHRSFDQVPELLDVVDQLGGLRLRPWVVLEDVVDDEVPGRTSLYGVHPSREEQAGRERWGHALVMLLSL